MGRTVLIVDFNLFREVGGGQTVYKNIIRRRPEDQFYYFTTDLKSETDIPPNATPIRFNPQASDGRPRHMPAEGHFAHVFSDSMRLAQSVVDSHPGIAFDVVDTPDYRQNGLFIRKALELHGVKVGVVALALHGTLTASLRSAWPWQGDANRFFAELHLRERLQFNAVDARYAISEFYAEEMQRRADLPVNLIDPTLTIRDTAPTAPPAETDRPTLAFIGRHERRKGPDLFIDLAWWVGDQAYSRLLMIGPDGKNHQGGGSDAILSEVARRRALRYERVGGLSQDELRALCAARTVIVAPSRYDQFNLVALEALLDGCPVLVSSNTGVARWIRERLPSLSDLVIDTTCDRLGGDRLARMLANYDAERERIVQALKTAGLKPDLESLDGMYVPTPVAPAVKRGLDDMAARFYLFSEFHANAPSPEIRDPTVLAAGGTALALRKAFSAQKRAIGAVNRRLTPIRARLTNSRSLLHALASRRVAEKFTLGERTRREFNFIGSLPGVYEHLHHAPERTDRQIEQKIDYLNRLVDERRTDRVRWFRELARLERKRGADLIGATYDMRVMRWLNADHFGMLGSVRQSLEAHGFERESQGVEAMFGDPTKARAATHDFLKDQYGRHLSKPDLPLQIHDDRRGDVAPKVSVIVSLYNAQSKMSDFIGMLRQQTLAKQGQMEVIFVDSGSPTDERGEFEKYWSAAEAPFPALYARSANRETIQAAWNRGIKLSRGEYLAFYGVDEGMRPDCLERLSAALDQQPEIDWVIADSVVTDVDRKGAYANDIMIYDRADYQQHRHYLDTTYLSWVGGLYRRSMHDRFGYYDENFRAAGDTEFKNRILPHIKSARVPAVLGVFNNYPEERTTQHPRAEIEDFRAWYLHRSYGGMAYAFDDRAAGEAMSLLWDTLNYRKCFCYHRSTDVELMLSLGDYMADRFGEPHWSDAQVKMRRLAEMFTQYELWRGRLSGLGAEYRFADMTRELGVAAEQARQALKMESPHAFDVFNDNRYEQHWWSWSQGS